MNKGLHDAQEAAEIVAVQALSFIASEPEQLGLFLAETGLGPQNLREAASDPRFLAGVLDFVMRSDKTVEAFASSADLTTSAVAAAREVLGDQISGQDFP